MAAIAKPYPSRTIAAVLGAPVADAGRLEHWSSMVQRQFDIAALSSQIPDIEQAVVEAHEYVTTLLEQRRATPGPDLISTLLAAEEEGDRLTHDECVNLVLNLLAGGVDTTQSQLSQALRLFADAPRPVGAAGRGPGHLRQKGGPGGAAVRADRAVHRADRPRGHRAPGRALPGGHDRRGLRGTGQPGDAGRGGVRHHRRARRQALHLRRGRALLPRRQPRPGRAGRGARLPRPAACPTSRWRATPVLGGIEGIYNVESLPLRWS